MRWIWMLTIVFVASGVLTACGEKDDEEDGLDSDSSSDTGNDTGTGSDTTPDTETGSETETGSDTETGSETDTGSDMPPPECDLSNMSIEQTGTVYPTCLTLPDGMVLQPGETVVVARFGDALSFQGCFPEFPALDPVDWPADTDTATDTDTSFQYFSWYSDGEKNYLDGMGVFMTSGELPLTETDAMFTLRDAACTGGGGWNGDGMDAVGNGAIVDGPTMAVPAISRGFMVRADPPGDGSAVSDWTIVDASSDTDTVYGGTPGHGGVSGLTPRITEINNPDSMGMIMGCQLIEITCPGGPAYEFCAAGQALGGCGDTLETCLHSVPNLAAVSQQAIDCATSAVDCTAFNETCWPLIVF